MFDLSRRERFLLSNYGVCGGLQRLRRGFNCCQHQPPRRLSLAQHHGHGQCECSHTSQQQFPAEVEFVTHAFRHDADDAFFQVGPGDARDTGERGFYAEFADTQDRVSVVAWLAAEVQHGLIARTLAFLNQPRSNPPDQRMEPKDCLYDHVNRSGQIVTSSDVAQLVGQYRFQLGWREMFQNVLR